MPVKFAWKEILGRMYMIEIAGRVHDTDNKPLPSQIMVQGFQDRFLFVWPNRPLGPPVEVDRSTGSFTIRSEWDFRLDIEGIVLTVSDPDGKFALVRERQRDFQKIVDNHGKVKWRSQPIDNISSADITVAFQHRQMPDTRYEAVVVGSGFGGTIAALTLANYLESKKPGAKVCVLERGQWWVSHEMPATADGTTDGKITIRAYLEKNNIPYGLWAYPDDLGGLLRLIGYSRGINPVRGLYDFRTMKNLNVLTGSGVGGGSLVYFNITEKPDATVYENWAVQSQATSPGSKSISYKDLYGEVEAKKFVDSAADIDIKQFDYFDAAESYIGVNAITTTAALAKFKLPKTKVFQDAARAIKFIQHRLANKDDMDARLSITDTPAGLFGPNRPTKPELMKYARETNICQRQGRCGLGCVPGARHTLNKQLYNAISKKKPLEVFPLCEVTSIKESNNPDFRYVVSFKDRREGERDAEIETKQIILAAGTLGSTAILLRSGTLRLSKKLGTSFSANADMFGVITPTTEVVNASRGPLQTSIARFTNSETGRFEFSVEDLGIPKMFAPLLAPVLNSLAANKQDGEVFPSTNMLDFITTRIPGRLTELGKLINGLHVLLPEKLTEKIDRTLLELASSLDPMALYRSPEERVNNILVLFGLGLEKPKGQLILGGQGDLDLKEERDFSEPIFGHIIQTMKLFAKQVGKNGERSLVIPFWSRTKKMQLTAHPLGGCSMGRDSAEGVVDGLGRVFKGDSGTKEVYEGLYVVDGSIIPSSLGVNPSLTITALALLITEHIVGSRGYWPFR